MLRPRRDHSKAAVGKPPLNRRYSCINEKGRALSTVETFLPRARWSANNGIVPSLDGLRAVSIIIVLAGHMVLPQAFVGISALGLDVFFFISGFLISRLLFAEAVREGHIHLGLFFLRRFLRLYPVLVTFMGLALVVQASRGGPIPGIEVASVFLYFYNFLLAHNELFHIDTILPIGVLWSLSVEEQFYLVAPLIFIVVQARPRPVLRAIVAICIATLLLRYLYIWIWPGLENTLWIYRHSETRADALAFGVLLASLCQLERGRETIGWLTGRVPLIVGVAILLGTYAIRDTYFQNTIRFTLQSLSLVPIVCGVVFGQPFPFLNAVLNAAPVRWVGRLSYSIYIWHGGVDFFFGRWLEALPRPLGILCALAATVAMATASYYGVERPALRLRRFLQARRPVADSLSRGMP